MFVRVLPLPGIENDLIFLPGAQGFLGHGFHGDEPLLGEVWFDDGVTAIAVPHLVVVLLFLEEESLLLKVRHHRLPGVLGGEAAILRGNILIQGSIVIENIDLFKIMAIADIPVVGIVGGGHLHHTGTEFLIHVGIGHDLDGPFGQGESNLPADVGIIAVVIGIHRQGGITEHGLRPGGGYFQISRSVRQRIGVVVHFTGKLLVIHLIIRQGGLTGGAPVYQVVSLIDQIPVIKFYEDLPYRVGTPFIQGETFPVPVAGGTDFFQLVGDDGVMLLFHLPGFFYEFFPAQFVPLDPPGP